MNHAIDKSVTDDCVRIKELGYNPLHHIRLYGSDLDSGNPTRVGEYSLTDATYAKLLAQLAKSKFDLTTPELRANVLQFYTDVPPSIQTKDDKVQSTGVLALLDQLRAATPVPAAEAVAAR